MVPDNIREIARKFFSGAATEEEIARLHQWYDAWADDEIIIQADTDNPDIIEARMLSRMLEKIRSEKATPAQVVPLQKKKWWKVGVAAAVIMALGVGAFLWKHHFGGHAGGVEVAVADTSTGIKPGIDKALLILADGKQVVLDSTTTGIVSKQGATTIINLHGKLTYDGAGNQQEEPIYYNTIKTGKGNQYQLVLPDGSRVWLNATSSLRFPTRFNKENRTVELTGEGYFEVARENNRPFKVMLQGNAEEKSPTSIEVLGTHFNVMDYNDEPNMKVTLLEGSVKVRSENSVVLKPGEQAVMSGNSQLTIDNSPNLEEAVAWKNGYFQFTDAPITTVMRQVARWYNVDVEYSGNVKQEIFSGSIPRLANITELKKILELTKTIRIKIEGRKLITAPY